MSHSDILDAIDSSLRDNSVSADAMRWTPDPEAAELTGEGYTRGDGAGGWPTLVIVDEVDWDAISAELNAFFRSFAEAAQAMGQTLHPFAEMAARTVHARDARERPRWHRIRCRQCNPAGNPLPLPGGQEYQRRQQARRRRATRQG